MTLDELEQMASIRLQAFHETRRFDAGRAP